MLDKSKEYTLEDIEKYKLLTDPTFPQYYYNKEALGDRYLFASGGMGSMASPSIMMQSATLNNSKAPKVYDYQNSLRLRNAGIGLMVSGVVACFTLGVGHLAGEFYGAGIAYMTIGSMAVIASIPMVSVGSVRLKNAQTMDVTLNAGANGVGLGLSF